MDSTWCSRTSRGPSSLRCTTPSIRRAGFWRARRPLRIASTEPVTVEQAAAAAWALPRGPLHAQLPHRPLGRRVDADAGDRCIPARACWRAAAASPATRRIRGLPSRPATPTRTTAKCGLARWAGAAPGASPSSRTSWTTVRVTGGFNPFDFGYVLQSGREAGDAGFLWRLCRTMAWAAHRGCCTATSCEHILPRTAGHGRAAAAQAAAGHLQLLGGDRIQRERGRADGAR